MNIAEILRKCPRGTKLYSPVFGEVELAKVDYDEDYPITCITENGVYKIFTSDGMLYCNYPNAECMLFPSREQRDWSKFVVSVQVTDQETKPQFKPFDKVFVRDSDSEMWNLAFFAVLKENSEYKFGIIDIDGPAFYSQCIPYEGNENLLGTKNKP